MNKNKRVLVVALAVVLGLTGTAAQAAVLQAGDILTIDAGVPIYDSYGNLAGVSGGSWFGLDGNWDNRINLAEKYAIAPGAEGGIVIGSPQAPGDIDMWTLNGITGHHYTETAPTGSTISGLDFSGWFVYWNGATVVSAANKLGAWTPLNCDALGCVDVSFDANVAAFTWSGVYGDSYTLWYAMQFCTNQPFCDPAGYLLYLEGMVLAAPSAVPLPAAAWLFGSGMLALLSAAGRRRLG